MDSINPIAVIIVVGVLVASFYARRYAAFIKPPRRIHLVPETSEKQPPKGVQRYSAELQHLGFREIGAYRVKEIRGLALAAFIQSNQAVCAVAYHHLLTGSYVDMFSSNEEDLGLTVSNARAGHQLDQPPGRPKIIDRTLDVRTMYDRLLKERPKGSFIHVDARNFVEVFETEYAKEMDWRLNRGGVTDAEVKRIAKSTGIMNEQMAVKAGEIFRKQYEKESTPS